jgi:hypothetical protein
MNLHQQLKNLPKYGTAAEVPMATRDQGLDHYKKACDLGMTFWQYMEIIQPSKPGDNLTAFERQLQLNGIVTKSNPEAGLYSSIGEYFFQSDRPGSLVLFPVLLQKVALWAKLMWVPDINKIVATTRTISGSSSFLSLYIDDSAIVGNYAGINGNPTAHGRRFRVDQRGNFPSVKIGWSDHANAVTKHGVKLEWTYEFVRRASIELMTTVVARIMIQDQLELFDEAMSVAISGDGSPANPPAQVVKFRNSGTVDSRYELLIGKNPAGSVVAAGEITYEGWLKWIGQFKPYNPSMVCGNMNTLVKLVLMAKPNVDPMAIITTLLEPRKQGSATFDSSIGQLFPNVTLYWSEAVPDDVLVGMDTAFGLERVIELGSDIQEMERVITNQTECMVLSIADTVSKLFRDAIQVLDFHEAPLTG